jgi:hypothetical protein
MPGGEGCAVSGGDKNRIYEDDCADDEDYTFFAFSCFGMDE